MIAPGWTDDRVASLKKLWEAGATASAIAAELGHVTRNAVIGKATRLGLAGRAKSPSSPAPRRRRRDPSTVMVSIKRTALSHALGVDVEPETPAYDTVIPLEQRASLVELTDEICHWPVGHPSEPDFFFCGGKAVTGAPYCAHHARVAYMSANQRRQKKPGPKPRSESWTGAWY